MNLNRTEIEDALANLSPADTKRIKHMSRNYAHGLVYLTAEDLLHEVYVKLLAGERVFPRDSRPVMVVINAMHSVASNCRDREDDGAVNHYTETSTVSQNIEEEDEGDTVTTVMSINEVTPEQRLESKQSFAQIQTLLADDPELQDVATAWGLGIRSVEAANYLGWEMHKYEAARKRLMRRLDAMNKE